MKVTSEMFMRYVFLILLCLRFIFFYVSCFISFDLFDFSKFFDIRVVAFIIVHKMFSLFVSFYLFISVDFLAIYGDYLRSGSTLLNNELFSLLNGWWLYSCTEYGCSELVGAV